ncbi:MAG: AAA family ATPase [bacterium]|nr:AAA family ATPase [bacterium]
MTKRFNDTGVCVPEKHYMADISAKINLIFRMVRKGDYFAINRPRQYGKTTIFHMLNRFCKSTSDYFPIKISFEGFGSDSYKSEAAFIETFLLQLKRVFNLSGHEQLLQLVETGSNLNTIPKLDLWITDLVQKTGKRVVLMIDEVDKSSNNQLFLDFLGMLRNKYLRQNEGEDVSFYSVILAGVHDVKSLKAKIRGDEPKQFNSPWNIAADFTVELDLTVQEIASMLESYSKEENIEMDIPFFAERIHYYTSGYPFLASKLCKIIAEDILPTRESEQWLPGDIETAIRGILVKDNTNFQSLIKNLENNSQLYDLVFKVIMNGQRFSFNPDHPVIQWGKIYGILREGNDNNAQVHNRLYEQRIYNYMASKIEISSEVPFNIVGANYIRKDGSLNLEKAIRKFQEFMKEQYGKKDSDFIERNGRLLFLAFIKPIINGRGFDFKEVQVSEEKRLDVVITSGNHKYIVELKIWKGEAYHRKGIKQLCDYLDRQNQKNGYLLIYDLRKEKSKTGAYEKLESNGKTIFAAWL